jgi:hypothetical protein
MTTAFEVLSEIRDVETIAAGRGVYIRRYLERTYGRPLLENERYRNRSTCGLYDLRGRDPLV